MSGHLRGAVSNTEVVQRDWPIVGRSQELRELDEAFAGGAAGVVLAGPAGVGKSCLGAEFLHRVSTTGVPTLRILATKATSVVPLGVLATVLPIIHQPDASAVDNRVDLLRRCANALVERSREQRMVVLVDDAHLLDDLSAALIHQLVATDRVFTVATVLTSEPCPDAVTALWKDALLERWELPGLALDSVSEVLSAVLDAPVDVVAVEEFSARSEGNMLYLRELVAGALAAGTLRNEGGLWRLVGDLSPSQRLVELVERRLGTLTPAERSALELISIAEPLGPVESELLGDQAVVEGLERRGLVVSTSHGPAPEVRLKHHLYGDVLLAQMPALARVKVSRALAEAVEAAAPSPEDRLRVAVWRLEAGGGSADAMLDAALIVRRRYDFQLAERLARAALGRGAGFDARLLLADLAALQRRSADAESELADLARGARDDRERGLVAVARVNLIGLLLGRFDEALIIVDESRLTITEDAWLDELTALRAALLVPREGFGAAAAVCEPLLEGAKGRAEVWSCLIANLSYGRLGRVSDSLAAAERGHAAHAALTEPVSFYPWMHLFFRCGALTASGRFAEADELAWAQYEQGVEERSVEKQAVFAWEFARPVGDRGNTETAIRHALESAVLFRQLGRTQWLRGCLVHLALAFALSGRPERAEQVLNEPEAPGPDTLLTTSRVDVLQAWAWTAAANGHLPRARQHLSDAVTLASQLQDHVAESVALHGLARLGQAKQVRQELQRLTSVVEGDLVRARSAHTNALAAGDAAGLELAGEAFEAMGAMLLAAEAAADAGTAWRRAGEKRNAAAAHRSARELAARCEGATTPALQAIEFQPRLTRAELDAAMMAARGKSNREIADELVVSVRTVETQLQRVYGKLGLTSRKELATAFGPEPTTP